MKSEPLTTTGLSISMTKVRKKEKVEMIEDSMLELQIVSTVVLFVCVIYFVMRS